MYLYLQIFKIAFNLQWLIMNIKSLTKQYFCRIQIAYIMSTTHYVHNSLSIFSALIQENLNPKMQTVDREQSL